MIRAKKYLGQHFLHDENIAKRIVDAFKPPQEAFVVEIGYGTGVLSKYLIEKYRNILFFDVDEESYNYMITKFPEHNDRFLLKDFLSYDFSEHDAVNIIGNLPYNISSQIFFKIFENRNKIDECVFMVQKEVALRLVSIGGNKEFGILSVLLGLFFEIEKLFDVSNRAFTPPPKVTSSVIRLKSKGKIYTGVDDNVLKSTVRVIFNKRRKMLRNSLRDLGINSEDDHTLEPFLAKRPEQLHIEDFVIIAKAVQRLKSKLDAR